MIKKLLKVFKWLFVIYLFLLAGAYFFQEKLIFHSEKLPQDYQYNLAQKFEEVNLDTQDGETINALHLKVENPKGVILYFHGNAGSLKRWSAIVSFFNQFDYDVFVMDYRNYGKSTGNFNEKKMYADAQLCYDYLKNKYAENKIIVYGRSLGSTFATKVAATNKPEQLVLEAPFFSLTTIATKRYPIIPKVLLKYKFETNKYIKNVSCPITIFHGTNDWVVPYTSGKELFNGATIKEKQFITIANGGHNNLVEFKIYRNKIEQLLK